MEYLWRHVKDSFLMGEGEKVRREDPKKSKTGNKLKQDQVQNGTQQDADDRRGSHEAEQADKPWADAKKNADTGKIKGLDH